MLSSDGQQVIKKEIDSPGTTCKEQNAFVAADYRATESPRTLIPAPSSSEGTKQWKIRRKVVTRSPVSEGRYSGSLQQVQRQTAFPQHLPSVHALLSSTGFPDDGPIQHWHRASYPGASNLPVSLPRTRPETDSTSPPSYIAPFTGYALGSFSNRERHKLPPLDSLGGNRSTFSDLAHSRSTKSPDPTSSQTQNATTYSPIHLPAPLPQSEMSYGRSPSLSSHNVVSHLHGSFSHTGLVTFPANANVDGTTSPGPALVARYVGKREVPGEGLCHMYDDGTFCQAVIAGEPVNPGFGVTKAGRPRKRLAKACSTCREKKIKCLKNSPGYALQTWKVKLMMYCR